MDKPTDWKQLLSRQDLRQLLTQRYACFVLITCGEPTKEGKIEVEMTYEGDDALAAYLIENAQTFIEDESGV
jgi:hypothetical protein